MSILKMFKQSQRDKEKEKRRDFIKRRDAFFAEYKLLANKFKCDWNPYIKVDEHRQKATPHLEIIDATEYLEDEAKNKQYNKAIKL